MRRIAGTTETDRTCTHTTVPPPVCTSSTDHRFVDKPRRAHVRLGSQAAPSALTDTLESVSNGSAGTASATKDQVINALTKVERVARGLPVRFKRANDIWHEPTVLLDLREKLPEMHESIENLCEQLELCEQFDYKRAMALVNCIEQDMVGHGNAAEEVTTWSERKFERQGRIKGRGLQECCEKLRKSFGKTLSIIELLNRVELIGRASTLAERRKMQSPKASVCQRNPPLSASLACVQNTGRDQLDAILGEVAGLKQSFAGE